MGMNSELHFIPCLRATMIYSDDLWWLWWAFVTCSYWNLLPAPITISYPQKTALQQWFFMILHLFKSAQAISGSFTLHFSYFSRWHTQSSAPPRSFPRSELPLWEFPSRLRCIPPVAPPRYCHGSPAGPPAPLWSPAWRQIATVGSKPRGKQKDHWNTVGLVYSEVSFSVIFWILFGDSYDFLWILYDMCIIDYSCIWPRCLCWTDYLWSPLHKCLKNQGAGTDVVSTYESSNPRLAIQRLTMFDHVFPSGQWFGHTTQTWLGLGCAWNQLYDTYHAWG